LLVVVVVVMVGVAAVAQVVIEPHLDLLLLRVPLLQ
jgi:hypothetical protein